MSRWNVRRDLGRSRVERVVEAWGVVLGHMRALRGGGGGHDGFVCVAEVERVMHGVQRASGVAEHRLMSRTCLIEHLERMQLEGVVETRVVVRRVQGRGMTVKGPVRVWRVKEEEGVRA